MRCAVCGIESDFAAGFITERRSFRLSERTLCVACRTRRRYAFEAWYQIGVLAGGILGYVCLALNPQSEAGQVLTAVFLLDVFFILGIVPHELGHALAAHLVGWRVFGVAIGIGRQIYRFRRFGILFSFHWLPVGGMTRFTPVDARWFRFKWFVSIAAGPAVNGAVILAILLIWNQWREFGLHALPRPVIICLGANACVLVGNLWPHRSRLLNAATDGQQLLKTFAITPQNIQDLQAGRFLCEAMIQRDDEHDVAAALDWCARGLAQFPANYTLLNVRGVLCLDQGDYGQARAIFVELLQREGAPAAARHTMLNNIAYADALIGSAELLPEADAYSQEAYATAPWASHIVGTRGTVLVVLGQFEPGIRLLEESFEKTDSQRGKAENACHLAIAHAQLGQQDQADHYLDLARKLDPKCLLIKRAQANITVQAG